MTVAGEREWLVWGAHERIWVESTSLWGLAPGPYPSCFERALRHEIVRLEDALQKRQRIEIFVDLGSPELMTLDPSTSTKNVFIVYR